MSKFYLEPPFVGREDILDKFIQEVTKPTNYPFRILYIWGEKGIGKSRLLKEMALEAQNKLGYYTAISKKLDFKELSAHHGAFIDEKALFAMRKELGNTYSIPFPSFDLALLHYWRRCRGFEAIDQDQFVDFGLLGNSAEVISKVSEYLGIDKDDLNDIKNIAETVSFIAKAGELIFKVGKIYKRLKIQKRVPSLQSLEHVPDSQLLDRLFDYFVDDLTNYLSEPRKINFKPEKLLVFVDSYDLLMGNPGNYPNRWHENDLWFRKFIERFDEKSNILTHKPFWVIFSALENHWSKLDDADIIKYVTHYDLPMHSWHELRVILRGAGVNNDSDIAYLLEISAGNLWFLLEYILPYIRESPIQVGQYQSVPLKFGKIFAEILGDLSNGETQVFRYLSLEDNWDEQMFDHVVNSINANLSGSCETICSNRSFVTKRAGKYYMSGLVRRAFANRMTIDESKQIASVLGAYYEYDFRNRNKNKY